MAYKIHCASEWPLDQIAPYMSSILDAMGQLAKRFPKDVTTASLFQEFLSGKKTLWLILDDDAFVTMALTSIRVLDPTGKRFATLCDLAGNHVQLYAAELCAALEAWAEKNDAEPEIYGRKGWEPLLKQFGYRPHATLYRKIEVGYGQ